MSKKTYEDRDQRRPWRVRPALTQNLLQKPQARLVEEVPINVMNDTIRSFMDD
jgi:hypothetical protein